MSPLAKQEKVQLLQLARGAIYARLWAEPLQVAPFDAPSLASPSGAFVTLHHQGSLRGCIGRIRTSDPLHRTIQDMALAAAFEDPRFPPLSREEYPGLSLEISVLTPPEVIHDFEQVEVGRHGLILSHGVLSGLLLPQVAVEWGWDRDNFLSHTCIKAGLPEDFWKYGKPRVEIFSAEVFSEFSEGIAGGANFSPNSPLSPLGRGLG